MSDSGDITLSAETGPQSAKRNSSDSEDQFQDAQSAPVSPIPKTRVERVDDEPAHGEVPGTDAQQMRAQDAVPDEVEIVPEGSGSRRPSDASAPVTVVEEAPGSTGPHSQGFEDLRKADAVPDVVVDADGDVKEGSSADNGTSDAPVPPATLSTPETTGRARRKSSRASTRPSISVDGGDDDGDDDFGDDFDDFEEGGEEDDFDDFEDGFEQPEPTAAAQSLSSTQQSTLPFTIPDFDGLNPDDVIEATESYLSHLFPPEELDVPELPPLPKDPSIFTTPRSASLWSQLVAPPPLAPPDWIRSRTRRLFLVSLGVPVDLDEILPASKQKKLVLPSLNVPSTSPRTSSDSRSVSKLKQGDANASSTSVDTQGKPSASKRKKGPPPPPELDVVAARHMCTATEEALNGMTDEEVKAHVAALEALQITAKEVLEYWQKRTDEKVSERETFEGVIENLVKHARKVRK